MTAPSQWFCALLDSASEVYFRYALAPARRFEYVSPSVHALTGHSPDEFYADRDLCLSLVASQDRRMVRRLLRARRGVMLTLHLAEGQRTGGKVGTGLAVGVLSGLIGTGIGYFVIGPSDLSAEAALRGNGKSADYQLGLKTGWEEKTKAKRRNAFLAGGLLGTAAWVAIVVAANSGSSSY